MVRHEPGFLVVAALFAEAILLNVVPRLPAQPSSLEWQILSAALRHPDAMERHFTAAYLLPRLSDAVSEKWLLELLSHPQAGARMDSANALRFRSNPGMAETLLAAYWREREANDSRSFPSMCIRMWLLEALARSGHPRAAEMVSVGLDDPEKLVRTAASSRLRELAGMSGTGEVLRKLLRSGDPGIQTSAADLLGSVQAKSAVSDLASLLKHPDPRVQRSAASALCRLGNPAGAHLLRDRAGKETDEWQVRALLQDLAICGDAEARRTLLAWLSDRDERRRLFAISAARLARLAEATQVLQTIASLDRSPHARFQAAESLAGITGSREPLLAMLKDADEWNRLTAARLLLEQGDLAGKPALVTSLTSANPMARTEAARLAGRFLTPQEVDRLEDLLRDPSDNVRLYAAQAAGQLRAAKLLPVLKAILEEKRQGGYDLTAAAAEAIAEIGTEEAVRILREALKSNQHVTRLCAAVELIRLEQQKHRQAASP